MADIAEADPSYNKILLDREKFFKNDYESLPIPNIDMSYFDSQNTIDLMDFSPVLGALFVSYKNDICIIEKESIKTFWIKDENKVIKRINVIQNGGPVINHIKLSPCNHMIAVAAGNDIKIYSVKDMIASGTAKLLATFPGESKWEKIQWGPYSRDKPQDLIIGISSQKKLYSINLQTGQSKSSTNQEITCATFSSTSENILAINAKNEFLVFKTETMEIIKNEKIEFIDPDSFNITTLTHIQEIKPDFWVFSGVCNDSEDPSEASKHTYMIQGNIITKKLKDLPVQLFNEMFLPLIGFDNPTLILPYYKFTYIPRRDVILSGTTQGNEVTLIANKKGRAEPELKKYVGMEMGSSVNIKLKAPPGYMTLLRGFSFCTTRISESKTFEYLENDDEKTIPYPPLIFVLTSCGQIGKYAFIDKRDEFENDDILQDAPGITYLTRKIQLKDFGAGVSQLQAPLPGLKSELSVNDLPLQKTVSFQDKTSFKPPTSLIPQKPVLPQSQPSLNESGEVGTYQPEEKMLIEAKTRIKRNIQILKDSYKSLAESVQENVLKLLAEDDKKFYREWTEIESKLHKCKDFLNVAKKFFVKQNFFNQNLNTYLGELEFEAGMIKEIVVDQILEGNKIRGYRNTELSVEIAKCQKHFNSLLQKLDYTEDFIENYSDLYKILPTGTPDLDSKSPMKTSFERTFPFQESSNLTESEFFLNLQPISKSLKMSKVNVKTPEQKSLTKGFGNLKMSSSLTMKPSLKASQPKLQTSSYRMRNSVPKVASHQNDTEFHRQLVELSIRFKESLDHTAKEINHIKAKLENLNKKGRLPTIMSENKPEPSLKKSSSPHRSKKMSRKIAFPDSDSDFDGSESEEEPVDFFTNIIRNSQSSKLSKVYVEGNPFKKYNTDIFKGPKLEALFQKLHENLGKKYVPIKAAPTLFQQPQKSSIGSSVTAPIINKTVVEEKPKPLSLVDNKANISNLTDKKTGLLNFNLKGNAEEEKKTAAPSIFSGSSKPAEQKPQEETKKQIEAPKPQGSVFGGLSNKTNDKPAAPSIFGGALISKPETKETKPESTKPSIFNSISIGAKDKKEELKPTITKEETKQAEPLPSTAKATVSDAQKQVTEAKPTDALAAQMKNQSDKTEEAEESSIELSGESHEESKSSDTLPQAGKQEPPKGNVMLTKSVLEDLSLLDKTLEAGEPGPKDNKTKFNVGSLIKDGSEEENMNIPIPNLVRDDSYIMKKPEPPKVDYFKTMTERPSFLPPKKQENKEDIKDLLGFDSKQPVTLFSKKINEPKKEEKKEEEKKEDLSRPLEPVAEHPDEEKAAAQNIPSKIQEQPPKEKPQMPELSELGAQLDNQSGISTTQTQQIQPDNKPAVTIPPFNPSTSETKPTNAISGGFFGTTGQKPVLPNTSSTGPTGFNIAKPTDTTAPTGNIFQTATQNVANPQPMSQNPPSTGGFSFAQPQNIQGNRFAINTTAPQGTEQNQASNAPAFGSHGFPKFGSLGQPSFGNLQKFGTSGQAPAFGQHGGVAFGQSSSGFPQQTQNQVPLQQPQKVFGSGSTMFGGASQSQGTQNQGSGMLFSSAVSNPGTSSFFGSGVSQPSQPTNFGSGGAFGQVRKTKQI